MHFPLSRTIKNYIKGSKLAKNYSLEGWTFSSKRCKMFNEEVSKWQMLYLPINIKNKVILDVGAGEGETAKFFLDNGAKSVIAIEADNSCFENLIKNCMSHNISVHGFPFSLNHLKLNFDFMKMDIEGYEEILLNVDLKVPAVIELHGLQQIKKFRDKGYFVIGKEFDYDCVSYAYWSCKP